jgi:hypothetical protein
MYPGAAPASHEKLAILQRAALQLFAQGERQLTFSVHTLGQALKDALCEEGYGDRCWSLGKRVVGGFTAQ